MAILTGLFKSILGICETKPLASQFWDTEDGVVRVKMGSVAELSSKGGAVYLAGKGLDVPILIVRTEDDRYLAFGNKCTHGGRKIDHRPEESKLRCCSIGHSTFDYDGNVIRGIAKKPLRKYETEISEGDLLVKL
jgi:nitrite reductase/ring-hydroxylating ferredoxin subunit